MSAARPAGPSGRDRVIAFVARLLARAFFVEVETVGSAPRGGPVILAASHLNGFVDPVLLVARLGLLPRFLAKATLWDVKPARPLLRFARIIPVQRRVDAGDATDNRSTFAAAVGALEDRQLLAVFPEGTTHDDPTIRPLRTGVARIALQASAAGVTGARIVPIGITYEDKVAVRGRALIHFGPPIDVPDHAELDATGDPDHAQVRDLTDRLTEAIRDTTPDFGSTEEAVALSSAAAVALRPVGAAPGTVPLADTTELARRLTDAPRSEVDHVIDEVARYHLLLRWVGLTDEQLVSDRSLRALTRRTAWLAALVVLLAPFAVIGLFTNLVPALVVLLVGLVPNAPVSKGTFRVLVGAVVFPATWLAIAVWDVGAGWIAALVRALTFPLDPIVQAVFGTREGFAPSLLVFVAVPVLGFVALLFVERTWALIRDWRVWRALLDRRGQLAELRVRRAQVVATTLAAAERAHP